LAFVDGTVRVCCDWTESPRRQFQIIQRAPAVPASGHELQGQAILHNSWFAQPKAHLDLTHFAARLAETG
jgi:hypothetical protein